MLAAVIGIISGRLRLDDQLFGLGVNGNNLFESAIGNQSIVNALNYSLDTSSNNGFETAVGNQTIVNSIEYQFNTLANSGFQTGIGNTTAPIVTFGLSGPSS